MLLFCCIFDNMIIVNKKLKQRAQVVEAYLNKLYPSPACELYFTNEFELLVAVILSAQCTDKRVNKITPSLFAKYPKPEDFAYMDQKKLEKLIFSCGFYSAKAKAIIEASRDIVEKFDSKVPQNREDLMTLRGVGRKTANVILSVAFGKPAIAVDTHVYRIAKRFGLSKGETVWQVEQDLMKLFEEKNWAKLHYQMVLFGRYNSPARGKSDWKEKFEEFEKEYFTKKG